VSRRVLIRIGTALALAALAAPAAAAAGVSVSSAGLAGYPAIRVTVVGSRPTSSPPGLTENGRAVTGLTAQNLGRQKAVALVLDRSRSMAGAALADATAAARSFVTLKSPRDAVAVLEFGRKAAALTGFSNSTIDAESALAALGIDRRSGTALYDGVVLAASRLAAQPLPGRVVVVLTDGRDVSSTATLADAIAAARRAHAAVYPIGVAGAGFDAGPLRRLASGTGGTYHPVGSTAALRQVYAAIAQELARTWQLRYTTSARPGDALRLRATLPALGSASATVRLPSNLAAGGSRPSSSLPSWAFGPAGTLALGAAVAGLLLAAAALGVSAHAGSKLRARLEAHIAPDKPGSKRRRRSAGKSATAQLLGLTERAFGSFGRWRSLQRLLERANLPLRAAEFLYIQLGAAFVLGLVFAAAASSALATFVAMLVGASLPLLFAQHKARQRLKAFENLLPDLLITLAASLKAGHSFRQALQTVVDEGRPPASDEFRRVLTETSLGRPMDEALVDMSERVGSKNLDFVITAVTIQRQVGGSLAGLFDMVAEAVRQRQQFARKIKGLTAMGRMSAYVLLGLPFFLAAALTVLNPSYMSPLYHSSTGHMLLVVGLTMMAFGSAVLRKMVSFKG
jgi:tight adherence protein B